MIRKLRLKDKETGQIVTVYVRHINKLSRDSVTGTREVVFGRIRGKGRVYAFRIPTRFTRA